MFSSVSYANPLLSGGKSEREIKQRNHLRITSAQQAARLVKSRFGGKVLKIQKKKVNGNPGYRVKLLKSDGHIVSVSVDAQSGRIVGS